MITEGHSSAAPLLKQAVGVFRDGDAVANGGWRWLFLAEMAAIELWDYESWRGLTASAHAAHAQSPWQCP